MKILFILFLILSIKDKNFQEILRYKFGNWLMLQLYVKQSLNCLIHSVMILCFNKLCYLHKENHDNLYVRYSVQDGLATASV